MYFFSQGTTQKCAYSSLSWPETALKIKWLKCEKGEKLTFENSFRVKKWQTIFLSSARDTGGKFFSGCNKKMRN